MVVNISVAVEFDVGVESDYQLNIKALSLSDAHRNTPDDTLSSYSG